MDKQSVRHTDRLAARKIEPVRFSLVLGTVERTRELELFLASLDAQSHRDFELIVVDQNPDDRLAPILAPYEGRFPILHLRAERGLSRAFNLGLEHASGDVVAFPGDDCQYPGDLLDKVARFFVEHPEIDGYNGRSIDEYGKDSGGRFARRAGMIDKFNMWSRTATYAMFLRTASVRGVRFDEEMGPGAGTVWGAGDEQDYLLRVLSRGASVFYDPGCVVVHPQPVTTYDEKALHRAYSYHRGAGHAVRKHRYPLWFKVWWLATPLGGLVLYLVGLKELPGVRYRWNIFKGKLKGMLW